MYNNGRFPPEISILLLLLSSNWHKYQVLSRDTIWFE